MGIGGEYDSRYRFYPDLKTVFSPIIDTMNISNHSKTYSMLKMWALNPRTTEACTTTIIYSLVWNLLKPRPYSLAKVQD